MTRFVYFFSLSLISCDAIMVKIPRPASNASSAHVENEVPTETENSGGKPEFPDHFLRLPFTDPNVQHRQGWLYSTKSECPVVTSPMSAMSPISCLHHAHDFFRADEKPFEVVAAADGTATFHPSGSPSWGNYVEMVHNVNGRTYVSIYAHLASSDIPLGPTFVGVGKRIGIAGVTGAAGKVIHLHFEVHRDSPDKATKIDPYDIAHDDRCCTAEAYPDVNSAGRPCGPNYLWIECPPVYPGTSGQPQGSQQSDCHQNTEVCNGIDDNCNGVVDDSNSCWTAVYRFKHPYSEARCYGTSPNSYPPECEGYIYELEAFVLAATPRLDAFGLRQCSFETDHILVSDGSNDQTLLQNSGYDCNAFLGYMISLGSPTTNPSPFKDECVLWRFSYQTPVGGAHLFTKGPDDVHEKTCEGARGKVFSNFGCFIGIPPGC